MATKEQQLLAVRKRLLEDFQFYAARVLKIRTKSGEIFPFKLNRAQRLFLDAILRQWQETGRVRVIVLKGRQMGLSTMWGAFQFWWTSQHKGIKTLVITHKADSTKALFDMTKRYHDLIPAGHPCKFSTSYSSQKELKFDVQDSGYMVATAGADSVGRGETLQMVHASELAFWPRRQAKDILNGLMKAVPNLPDTFVCIESTAQGASGVFYEFWQNALPEADSPNGFIPVFLPWFIQDEYREPVIAGFTRTPEEEDLVALYGLDDEQLMFRRLEVAKNGLELFKQEYPCCAEEAFLTSGRPVFPLDVLHERMKHLPDIKYRMGLEMGPDPSFQIDPRGELLVYREIDPGEKYTIGGDVSEGVKGNLQSNGDYEGDYSVAQVFDSKKRQAAVWRGHVDPDYFATTLLHLGRLFNEAYLAVEVNNQGILPNTRLERDFHYPNLYERKVYDKTMDEEVHKVGFKTDQVTKPLIISELRAAIRDGGIELNDRKTIQELMTFVVNPQNGAMEAEHGCHDDTVMALAITNHIHEGVWEPLASDDSLYADTI